MLVQYRELSRTRIKQIILDTVKWRFADRQFVHWTFHYCNGGRVRSMHIIYISVNSNLAIDSMGLSTIVSNQRR